MRLYHFLGVMLVAALLSALVLVPNDAKAQSYGHGHNSYAFNHACYPSYSYYSYKAPVQHYGHTYGHQQYNHSYHQQYEYQYPVQKVVAQEIAVAPLIVTVPVDSKAVPVQAYGSQYYYSVGEAYQQKAAIRDVIREELRALVGGSGTGGAALPTPGGRAEVKTAPVTKTAPAAVTGPSDAPDTATPADLQAKVLAAFQGKANCVSCHGAGASLSGNFRLVKDDGKGGYQLVALSSDKRWKTYAMSSVGAMPPAAASDASKAMESEHLPSLLQWAAIK